MINRRENLVLLGYRVIPYDEHLTEAKDYIKKFIKDHAGLIGDTIENETILSILTATDIYRFVDGCDPEAIKGMTCNNVFMSGVVPVSVTGALLYSNIVTPYVYKGEFDTIAKCSVIHKI